MEVKEYSYEEYPEFNEEIKGAKYIQTTGDEMGVYYRKDIVYETKDGLDRHLEILEPFNRNKPNKKYPVLVYVQGSAWRKQDVYKSIPLLSSLARKGFCIAIVEYRESTIATFPAQAMDARNAIRYMSLHADEYSGDASKMFVGGSSSGGHTALLSMLLDDVDEIPEDLKEGVINIHGILDYYGAVDMTFEDSFPDTLVHHLPESPEGMEMGCNMREHPEVAVKGSVKTYITNEKEIPPVMIMHGTKDRSVNPKQSAVLYQKLKECGKEAELYFLKGADHGGSEFFSKEAVDIATLFMKKHM